MILSMTGYGRAQKEVNGRDITVELKSVNSRYFEYSSRMPRSFSFLEDRLNKGVKLAAEEIEKYSHALEWSEDPSADYPQSSETG